MESSQGSTLSPQAACSYSQRPPQTSCSSIAACTSGTAAPCCWPATSGCTAGEMHARRPPRPPGCRPQGTLRQAHSRRTQSCPGVIRGGHAHSSNSNPPCQLQEHVHAWHGSKPADAADVVVSLVPCPFSHAMPVLDCDRPAHLSDLLLRSG